jgi:integrase
MRTADQRDRILRTLVLPKLGDRPIASIKRSEIVALLDDIEDNNGARTADVALAHLRAVMNWFAARDDDFRPPIVRGMQRQAAADHRRARVLNDAEIRALWKATEATEPFPTLIRFLLAVPARRGEAAGLRWDEIDDEGIWLLPARRSKSGIEVARPLSKMALALLATRPRNCPYVFSNNGVTATTAFTGPKEKIDAASGVTDWRIHDLRRSGRSLLSRAGVSTDIAERCLGHAMPTIRATYDRHRYISEVRNAFELLAAEIGRIIDSPDAAVLAFRR